MSTHYFNAFKGALDDTEMNEEKLIGLMENTDFFLKVLRVKLESDDLEMKKQAFEEIKEFREILKTYQK